MTEEQIQKTIETGYLQLKLKYKLKHYFFPILLFLLVPAAHLFLLISSPLVRQTERMYWMYLISFSAGIAVLFLQRKRLKIKVIETKLHYNEIMQRIEKLANELKFIPVISTEKVLIARRFPVGFQLSWGEQITLIFDKNKLLINSICDPEQQASLVSGGRNAENINAIRNELSI
ncbi:MAG: hypothetical protein ACK5Z2_13275 [Bacteroidota bacterium]|jgi:hypothetical protein